MSLYIDIINTSVSPPKVTRDLQKGNPLGVRTPVDGGTVPVIFSLQEWDLIFEVSTAPSVQHVV
jgi:hypothetical protein